MKAGVTLTVGTAMAPKVRRISPDALDVRSKPAVGRAFGAVLIFATWLSLLVWRGETSRDGVALWVTGAVLLPWVGLRIFRALQRERHVLVRGSGRLLLDGQPLDVARVETRLVRYPLLQIPAGYAVSLWGMEVDGRAVELQLSRHATLMAASAAAGELEEFLEVARAERPERAR